MDTFISKRTWAARVIGVVMVLSLGSIAWAQERSPQDPENPLRDPSYSLTKEEIDYAKKHLRLGKPQAIYERVHEGYVVAQDARLKIPLWVQYELTREDVASSEEREDKFRPDSSIPPGARAELNDYKGSHFDRGHMAPAADMKRNPQVMADSFLLSNMAPQVGKGFNRGVWKGLEDAVRQWVIKRGSLTVITGPVFEAEGGQVRYQVIGKNRVAVPTHFFKIVVDDRDIVNPEAVAFLLPNSDLTGHGFHEYATTIDHVEGVTGLDFLSILPREAQDKIESSISTWQ